MKTCFKCGAPKPLDEFYVHPQMGDGHLNKCKECAKRDVREREKRKAKDKRWVSAERARARDKWRRLYRGNVLSPVQRKRHQEALARYHIEHPERKHACAIVNNALRAGRIVKPRKCEVCGDCPRSRALHAHHDDYSKPLEVRWLCSACHGVFHRKAG